jgi:two-component system phosphate regulon response regulator OmpR
MDGFGPRVDVSIKSHLMKIIILDDDSEIRSMLERYLSTQGMNVRTVPEAADLYRLLSREPFDLLVLDVSMPTEDGLSVCRALRANGETLPILMLTARGDPVDRIVGLEMGADDYLCKPFDPRELVARIRALVRGRQLSLRTAARPGQAGCILFGAWELDLDKARLCRDGVEVEIKPGEHGLLRALAMHPNRPLGRDKLIALSKQWGVEVSRRSIDVQVLRLRRLIEEDPASPRLIRTVWGTGYIFVPPAAFEVSPDQAN